MWAKTASNVQLTRLKKLFASHSKVNNYRKQNKPTVDVLHVAVGRRRRRNDP